MQSKKAIRPCSKLRFGLKINMAIVLAATILGGYWAKNHFRYIFKPNGSMDLPEQRYQTLEGDFPYRFVHSIHANVLASTSRYKMDYWIDLYYPAFDATIYLSYHPVRDQATLSKLCQGANALAFKHQIKASSIEESVIQTPKGYQAHVIELFGEVPTPFQFYTTDGHKHFLRGALYFKTATQNDVLAPAIASIKKDIIHMLNTLEWKK